MPKESASYKCLSLVMLDSVIKTSKMYYPQTLLEESKCEAKKTKMDNLVNDEIESIFSDDESDNEINLIMNLTIDNLLKFKYFNNKKSLMVYVNHVLLGFYLVILEVINVIHLIVHN